MTARRATRVGSSTALVLLALCGTWLGHAIEYLRVEGPAGFVHEMTGSVHLYLLPLGSALIVVIGVGGVIWLRALSILAKRLEWLRRATRGERVVADAAARASMPITGRAARPRNLWLRLAVAQVGLYVCQENIEARVAHLRTPGLGVALGHHWAVVPIHLGVAAALAILASRLVGHRELLEQAIDRHERIYARLRSRRAPASPIAPDRPLVLTPHQRWSSQRWQRPPPRAIAA